MTDQTNQTAEQDHGHEHSQVELQLAAYVRQLQSALQLAAQTQDISRRALLKLLPNEGDGVTVELAEPLTADDGQVSAVRLIRVGDKIEVQRG